MSEFEISVFASVICGILTIIFSVIAFICAINEGAAKSTILSALATILSAFFSFSSYANITVPTPNILPLNNETQIYDNKVGISIYFEESPFFEIYYSTNGIDPKYGNIYLTPINITESTTICARNKFLWRWSDVEKSSYIMDSDDKNDDEYNAQEIESIINEQDESVTQADDLENSSDIDDKGSSDELEASDESELLDDLINIHITSTESNDTVKDTPSNNINDSASVTESVLQPESILTPETKTIPTPNLEPIQTLESSEQPQLTTESETIYTITLMDKNGKNLSNKRFLVKCNGNIIAEVYTDSESTFYLSESVLNQPSDWRIIYELVLCKENLYDDYGQKLPGYSISCFNITDIDFEVLCDAYME